MDFFTFLAIGAGLFLIPSLLVSVWVLLQYSYYKEHLDILERAKHDKPNPQEGPDVIIVGAGVVGSVLATVLARDGRKVTVIERSMKPPERVPGETMMAGGLQAMKELGVEVSIEDVNGVWADRVVVYPPGGKTITFPLKENVMNCVNGNLIDFLRKKAINEKSCSVIEGNVKKLIVNDGVVTGIMYNKKGEENTQDLRAPLIILADGSYSQLRSVNIPQKPELCHYCVGMEVECKEEIPVVIIPTSIGCMVTYSLTPDILRIFLNGNRKFEMSDLEGIKGELPEWIHELYMRAVNSGQLHKVFCLYLPPSTRHVPGVITIGDAHSVRNSLGAAGMTVGVMDVATWRNLLKDIPDLYNYEAMFAAENVFAVRRKKYCIMVDLISRCVRHFLLPGTDGLKLLGKAFAEYSATIKEDYANMYTVIDTRPQLLLYHLTKVIMISLYQAFTSRTCCGLPCGFYQAGQVFCAAYQTIGTHMLHQIRSMVVMK